MASRQVTYFLEIKATNQPVPSLLDPLPAVQKSELTWKWAVRKNLSAADSHHRKQCCFSTNPNSVAPSSRVWEFPDEKLTVLAVPLLLMINSYELINFKHNFRNVPTTWDRIRQSCAHIRILRQITSKETVMFWRSRWVKSETKRSFIMSSLTSRGKQRRQGLVAVLWSIQWRLLI